VKFTGEYCIPGVSPKKIEDDHLERYKFASRFVRGKTVLDIACGTGYGSRLLADTGAVEVDGVDISDDVVAYARQTYAAENVHFSTGDICEFKSPKRYDAITCFETIEHVKDFRRALANLHALLADGGLLLISSPNRPITSSFARTIDDKPKNPHHVREFTIPELKAALVEHGFAVDDSNIFGQRQRPIFQSDLLRRLHTKFFRPDDRSSPAVTPVAKLAPRYFLIVATKIG
jgi:ubiquinone biosynthesis O-methyltransferase